MAGSSYGLGWARPYKVDMGEWETCLVGATLLMPEVIAPELSRIRQWVLERVDEPGSYLRKTSGDWGPSYMPTERIEEALRFTDLAHARTECRGGRGSITDTWGGALRPIEIEVSVHRLSPWDD